MTGKTLARSRLERSLVGLGLVEAVGTDLTTTKRFTRLLVGIVLTLCFPLPLLLFSLGAGEVSGVPIVVGALFGFFYLCPYLMADI